MDNMERGDYGHTAIEEGSPDAKQNIRDGDLLTAAGDAVANILHAAFQSVGADSLDERETVALSVLDRGRMHFTAELRGEL